jgi:signal transduction histidine kinase/ligand-binding sensor domain-containing protein/DNA-binding response OmpR family regulator
MIILEGFVFKELAAQNSDFKFRHLNSSNGLSNNQITTIHKDRYGFLWFGTISGLNRYDGHSFKVYKNIPGEKETIPFNNIQNIFEDHLGYLWIMSQDNLLTFFDPHKDVFFDDHYLFEGEEGLPREFVSDLVIGNDSNLWVSTNGYGVFKVDAVTEEITNFSANECERYSLNSNFVTDLFLSKDSILYTVDAFGVVETIDVGTGKVEQVYQPVALSKLVKPDYYSVFIDDEGDIWIFSEQSDLGLFLYDREDEQEIHFSEKGGRFHLSSNIVTGIIQDQKNRIWVSTDHGGLQIIDKKDFSVRGVQKQKGLSNGLTQNSVTSILRDDSGTIWIGTYKEGVNYYHPDLFNFRLYSHNPLTDDGLPANDIDCFAEDDEGNLYIGTNGNGLIYFDREATDYRVFRAKPGNPDSLSHDVIVSLLFDSQDRLWIGTYYGGLNCYDGNTFKRYVHDPDDPASIADNRIWKIFEDSEGRIWIGTLGGGLDLLDENNNRFLHYRDGDLNSVNSNFILTIDEDSDGNLWFGTSYGINVLNRTTGRFSHISANPGKQNALSHPIVLSILEDQRGLMWFGTRNGLNMYNPHTREFKLFLERDGLPDNNILNLQEDEEGNIWMSTLNGLSKLELKENEEDDYTYSFINYDLLDGLQGREFNEHSSYETSAGELLFGGPNGFNLFKPGNITKNSYKAPVLLTELRLFNKKVDVGDRLDNTLVLDKPLFITDTLELKHNQNVFSVEFSGMGYFHPEKIKYQYKLENFNDQWVATESDNRQATYTNLNPGTYKFLVRSRVGEDGSLSDATSLLIIVKPPFYATKYAYGAYIILFAGLVVFFGFVIRRREKIKYERHRELMEHQRIHEIDAMKIKFFTNISHEFRTPLTLIISPLEKLMKEIQDAGIKEQLKLVSRNARRLLALVNQLLDLRKMEVQGIVLNRSKADIVAFVKDVAISFSDLFESKSIDFTVSSNVSELTVSFDPDKLEKIIFNLLSNAFKYSNEQGIVKLKLDYSKSGGSGESSARTQIVRLSVSDNGIGIPPEKQDEIFERFFQVNGGKGEDNLGSGIGLAITKEFVRLHGGEIRVNSAPGQGSEFVVDLPALQDEDISVSEPCKMVEKTSAQFLKKQDSELVGSGKEKPLLLIVEDNEELRAYLKNNLRKKYRVAEAVNGNDGLEKANTILPDLIVSDIMMPGIDGVEMCRKLKADTKTSYIPVILLTAKVSGEEEVEGLEAGADDYIAKPFNYEVLELKLQKLIEARQLFQEKLKKQHFEISPGEIGVSSLDEKFIKKATKFVEKNLSDTELSVEGFSKEMGVSRGHLYNKINALTGKTPSEFIRIMRLKRGAQLLGKSQLTVGEIAFKVGFNDPKYFSRYFKDEFGVSPSEYAKRISRNVDD